MVVARHPHAQEILKRQLHTADFHRTYLAVCEGAPEPPPGQWTPLWVPGRARWWSSASARTGSRPHRYETIRQAEAVSLLRLKLETGRTHQIRVHLAWLGHPLVGDFLYGREDPGLIRRPALHSAELSFRHPITGKRLSFSQPLPEDMAALLEGLPPSAAVSSR